MEHCKLVHLYSRNLKGGVLITENAQRLFVGPEQSERHSKWPRRASAASADHVVKIAFGADRDAPRKMLTPAQKQAITEVHEAVNNATGHRKRRLAAMFLDTVDREVYPSYYEAIPNPRALEPIRINIEKNK